MSLRDIHDFELALLAPLMAMTLRGVKIDEARRLEMVKALEEQREPLAAKIQEIVLPLLENAKRLPKASLFKTKWTCACCRAGGLRFQIDQVAFDNRVVESQTVSLMPCASQLVRCVRVKEE